MRVQHVLEQSPSEGCVLGEQHPSVNACKGRHVAYPILVCQEEILAGIFQLFYHVLYGVVVRLHQHCVGIQYKDMRKLLWAVQIIYHHLMLLPIEVLAFNIEPAIFDFSLVLFAVTLLLLPRGWISQRRLPPDNHRVALVLRVVSVCRQGGAQPAGSLSSTTPLMSAVHEHGRRDQDAAAGAHFLAGIDHEPVVVQQPGWPLRQDRQTGCRGLAWRCDGGGRHRRRR
mmetsp:Transcript_43795/g.110869  ORF Transcript_43795/g.110869 Transcript_43795/m.110869 type:complete len:227 (+) Transcript_43795:367-1047(+)